jgi:hypothetical protein
MARSISVMAMGRAVRHIALRPRARLDRRAPCTTVPLTMRDLLTTAPAALVRSDVPAGGA